MGNLTIRPFNTAAMGLPAVFLFHSSLMPIYKLPPIIEGSPDFCYLVEGGDQPLLVDTGMCSTERAHQYHHPSFQHEGMSVIEQLAKAGYKPEDIGHVVLTHLHWDHCYHLEMFVNARFYAHPTEIAFAADPTPTHYKEYEHPVTGMQSPFSKVKLEPVTENTEIIPGVTILDTPGHTPGCMSVIVKAASGDYICAGDALATSDNLLPVESLHYNVSPPGYQLDFIKGWASVEKVKSRVSGPDRVLCSHDYKLLDRIATEPVLR